MTASAERAKNSSIWNGQNRSRVNEDCVKPPTKPLEQLFHPAGVNQARQIRSCRPSRHDIEIWDLRLSYEFFLQVFLDRSPFVQKITQSECVRKIKDRVQSRQPHIRVNDQNALIDLSQRYRQIRGDCGLSLLRGRTGDEQDLRRVCPLPERRMDVMAPR